MSAVRKAVIPAAGLGTRFLPATKAQPKEMLPVVDKPAIQYVVEEAVRSGIDDILIITGRGKRSLEDHFDRSIELEVSLEASGKHDQLSEVRGLADLADIHYVRQGEALGLGHAVSVARKHVGDSPFVVMLGDDIMDEHSTVLGDMIAVYGETGASVVAFKSFPPEEISSYGCADPEPTDRPGLVRLRGIVEKPKPEDAPSDLAVMGRYLFTHEIFDALDRTKPGRGRRDPAHRRHRHPARRAAGVRLRVRRGPLRHRQEARLPAGHGRAGAGPRGPRSRVPRVPRRRGAAPGHRVNR